jgi:DNA polymerase III delta prime subunit
MANLPVHESSLALIKAFVQKPAHALILQSASSQALQLTADFLATSILDTFSTKDNPAVLVMPKNSAAVGIDEIREIQKFIKLKAVGLQTIRRIICILNAEKMTTEAQNALLKILEEPPLDTILIICTKSIDALLPTIRSRAQTTSLKNPTRTQYMSIYSAQDPTAVEKAFLMSDGLPEAMDALLLGETENSSAADITQAKQILGSSAFDRLIQVEAISKNKTAPQVLKTLESMCYAALKQAASKNAASSKQWARRLKLILDAERDLTFNVSSKIVLTDLFLQM